MRDNNTKNKINVVLLGCAPQSVKTVYRLKKSGVNIELVGYLDNDKKKWGTSFYSYPVIGGMSKIPELKDDNVYFCNMITRTQIDRYDAGMELIKNNVKLTNLIDPSVDTEFVKLGNCLWIQENVILQTGVKIGDNVDIHHGSILSHDATVGDSSVVAVGCNICGSVEIGEGVFVGSGATILPEMKVGKWSVIGAGSVVTRNVPDYSLVVGNPAKVMKKIDKTQLRSILPVMLNSYNSRFKNQEN
jgi:sugar O-acyltransferase (sialic acid O-acetyltransferase NeuD family)